MTIEQKINLAAKYKGISQAELARLIGMSPSNFNLKVKRDTFRKDELEKMGKALGAEWFCGFRFSDGFEV
ncbi:MAG: helix-turn-helix transcriptional regulator [Oscillospiraceae bacterium]|nr:helix-turn-helix transcriptional regulator [Oscillospiraceae bacterium]